ncbi:MAG TPA: aspartyl/asparaginyl beta-hydroxylase domain-containing protein [Pyrinomonadaceae bacterium]|nr:aspartyl/asparaginyl beta-hydroxylase domain-containing protein [Pyrinomonadaceae bacterium]
MIATLKLPFTFDADALRRDVDAFAADEWSSHFNQGVYEGDWSGVPLRTAGSSPLPLYPDPTSTDWYDTKQMERCEYVPQVLASFECDKEAVRFLRLGPGAEIREHRDFMLNIDDGVARVHVPIVTSEKVAFHLNGEPIAMRPGEAWYLDFNLPHTVKNDGDEYRVHLVIDLIANDWLRSFFPAE